MEKIPINMEISRFRRIADSCQQLCSQLPTRLLTDVSNLADKRQPLNKANIFRADASNSLPINILVKILYLIEY